MKYFVFALALASCTSTYQKTYPLGAVKRAIRAAYVTGCMRGSTDTKSVEWIRCNTLGKTFVDDVETEIRALR